MVRKLVHCGFIMVLLMGIVRADDSGTLYIYGGTIYTMKGVPIQNGVIRVENGKITYVGRRLKVPSDALSLDATGKVITPGFMVARSTTGVEIDTDIPPAQGSAITPGYSVLDAINLNDPGFEEARQHGITSVHIVPPGNAPMTGTGTVLKTGGANIRRRIVRDPASLNINLIANNRTIQNETLGGFSTEVANIIAIRNQFRKAMERKNLLESTRNIGHETPMQSSIHTEVVMQALDQEIPVMIAAQSPTEIERGLSLADDFGLTPIFVGIRSIDQLWNRFNSHYKFLIAKSMINSSSGSVIRPTPNLLLSELFQRNFYLQVVVDGNGIEGTGAIRYLSVQAAILGRWGVSTETLLKSMTLYPAQMLDLGDRLGSIEVGKDADLIIFNEGPLTTKAIPDFVIIDGRIVSEGLR